MQGKGLGTGKWRGGGWGEGIRRGFGGAFPLHFLLLLMEWRRLCSVRLVAPDCAVLLCRQQRTPVRTCFSRNWMFLVGHPPTHRPPWPTPSSAPARPVSDCFASSCCCSALLLPFAAVRRPAQSKSLRQHFTRRVVGRKTRRNSFKCFGFERNNLGIGQNFAELCRHTAINCERRKCITQRE